MTYGPLKTGLFVWLHSAEVKHKSNSSHMLPPRRPLGKAAKGEKLNYPPSVCLLCPPADPHSKTPGGLLDPHFGNHCPKWLIKLLYFRVPYGHRDHRKHLLGGPGRGHLLVFMEAQLLTQSPLSDCASLFTHDPSRVTARTSGSKRTSRDDKFRKFPLFFFSKSRSR